MKLNSKIKCLLIILLFGCIILGTTFQAAAHKVILYAYVDGKNIIVEGGFGDGSIAGNAEVKVYDPQDNLLCEGITDDNGIYEFSIPAKTDLRIVLDAGMGHQAEYTIAKDELPEVNNGNTQKVEDTETTEKAGETEVTGLNEEQLRTIISQELNKKIAPLNKKLIQLESSKGAGITEIIGGIGYIFGIMGLALYFIKGRTKS